MESKQEAMAKAVCVYVWPSSSACSTFGLWNGFSISIPLEIAGISGIYEQEGKKRRIDLPSLGSTRTVVV